MRRFCWVVPGEIPRSQDLRLCGWQSVPVADDDLLPASLAQQPALILVSAPRMGSREWRVVFDPEFVDARRFVTVLDVVETDERVRMLEAGVGEAFAPDIPLGELSARAERVLEIAQMMPRVRNLGELQLDLFARDAFAAGRPLGLHPREFDLFWRLAETPGKAIGKAQLIADVWRQHYVPDTNSLAVHVSRLRAKLATAGFDGIVVSVRPSGYSLESVL